MSIEAARYTWPAIGFHWLIAALVLGGWGMGFYMEGLPVSPEKLKFYSWHKWNGMTVLLLAVLRALWRATHAPPPVNLAHPLWQRRAAALVHRALYVLMFAVPLSGWTFSSASGYPVVYFGLLQLPDLVAKNKELAELLGSLHGLLTYALAAIVLIHVGAALQHQFIHRDGTLSRMLPFLKSSRTSQA